MRKRFSWSLVVAAVAIAGVAACGGDDDTASPTSTAAATDSVAPNDSASPTDLVAVKKSPASLAPDDPAWREADATTVKTTVVVGSEATGPSDVAVQALYSDTDVWFRFEWADSSKSTRAWVYDGTAWKKSPDNEDRLALYWEITPNEDFQTRGCAALCHSSDTEPIDKWYMIAPEAAGTFDNWHWKSARSNPVGQVDDKFLTGALSDPEDIESANKGDAKESGGYKENVAGDGKGPAKMQDPSKQPSAGAGSLLVTEAVALDVSKLKAGDTIPREMLEGWTGSRGDIEANGTWADGKWIVVFHRKLDTGHDDDVQFSVGETYPFGLSVFNNLDGYNHTVSKGVYILKFK